MLRAVGARGRSQARRQDGIRRQRRRAQAEGRWRWRQEQAAACQEEQVLIRATVSTTRLRRRCNMPVLRVRASGCGPSSVVPSYNVQSENPGRCLSRAAPSGCVQPWHACVTAQGPRAGANKQSPPSYGPARALHRRARVRRRASAQCAPEVQPAARGVAGARSCRKRAPVQRGVRALAGRSFREADGRGWARWQPRP
jgi:hypothetical protein